jgi:hypothetical protein
MSQREVKGKEAASILKNGGTLESLEDPKTPWTNGVTWKLSGGCVYPFRYGKVVGFLPTYDLNEIKQGIHTPLAVHEESMPKRES